MKIRGFFNGRLSAINLVTRFENPMQNSLRELVFENLNNAKLNTAFEPGGSLRDLSMEQIAIDLCTCSADLDHIDDIALVLPHMEAWFKEVGTG